MAINFEAANMAGYNNPKIEVFKANMDITTHIISDAPNKQEIIRCLRRGSIPALLVITADGSEVYLLWICGCIIDNEGVTIAFGDSDFQITYIAAEEQPIFGTGG